MSAPDEVEPEVPGAEDDEDVDDYWEDEDPDPPDEVIASASGDYRGVMTYDGPVPLTLGRWGDTLELRLYGPREACPPDGETRWTGRAGTDAALDEGLAALFAFGVEMLDQWDFTSFRCDERAYIAWRKREEADEGAPWQADHRAELARLAEPVAAELREEVDRVLRVLDLETPDTDEERELWWHAELYRRGWKWDRYHGLTVRHAGR